MMYWCATSEEQLKYLLEAVLLPYTLNQLREEGIRLLSHIQLGFFDPRPIVLGVRKRGYTDKGNLLEAEERERREALVSQEVELATLRDRILMKQMAIFERHLDTILEASQTISNKIELRKKWEESNKELNEEQDQLFKEEERWKQEHNVVTSNTKRTKPNSSNSRRNGPVSVRRLSDDKELLENTIELLKDLKERSRASEYLE
jgi:hypothetical protein